MFGGIYRGRRVFVTGHTGFKGSWLTAWLLELGAEVAGYSIGLPSDPCIFEVLRLRDRLRHRLGDVRDRSRLAEAIDEFRPEIVFHLAAQALVRRSYEDPTTTFEVNALGTMNVLECLRHRPWVRSAVLITSDKCYRNAEWIWGYREDDVLGGQDPYSGSKGCAELIAYSYFHSYFQDSQEVAAVATARAGNVIGGGDWAEARLVPDCVRSWSAGETVTIRSPNATRPWQHVLEPLSGYLWLGCHLWNRNPKALRTQYNFGPDAGVTQSVADLIRAIGLHWPEAQSRNADNAASGKHEATLLKLCCDKALGELQWQAVLPFDETVRLTSQWYRDYYGGEKDMADVTVHQIADYCRQARQRGLPWTRS